MLATALPHHRVATPCRVGPSSVKASDPRADVVIQATRPSVNLVPEEYDGRFGTFATVVGTPRHGTRLCHMAGSTLPRNALGRTSWDGPGAI
jgi:hypothetical protein